ncbi:STAS domain protein [Phycisphaerae bacterium RAS1]|nr:STAS domain protein [Phycisphaerae bacterium RAS1]
MAKQSQVTVERRGDVAILSILCRSMDEPAAQQLHDDGLAASSEGPTRALVVDMSKVEFAPSVALGAFIRLAQALKLSGQRLVIVGVTQRVHGTFSVTRLDKVLERAPTRDDALRMLGAV